jgi:hypothetical protein
MPQWDLDALDHNYTTMKVFCIIDFHVKSNKKNGSQHRHIDVRNQNLGFLNYGFYTFVFSILGRR